MAQPILPQAIVALMAQRAHRIHHYLWHEVRNSWLFYNEATRNAIRALGWEPPRPARRPTANGAAPILDNDSGEDFLYMHRQMIALVNTKLAEIGQDDYPKVEGWQPIPGSGDVDFAVPPAWDTGDAGFNSFLQETKSDDFFTQTIQPWEAQYGDAAWLSSVSLGELGARIEFTIHNRLHMRFCSEQDNMRPDVDPNRPDDIDVSWDDPTYNWLGDTYSSHVHPWFWKLHGWVDDRIETWKQANGVTGEVAWQGTWVGNMPADMPPHALHALLTAGRGRRMHEHQDNLKKLLKIVQSSGVRCHFYDRIELPMSIPITRRAARSKQRIA